MISHTKAASAEEKARVQQITDELRIYLNSREVAVQDRVNACLNHATEVILMTAEDPVQTREAWLQHCARIYDETLEMVAQRGAKA